MLERQFAHHGAANGTGQVPSEGGVQDIRSELYPRDVRCRSQRQVEPPFRRRVTRLISDQDLRQRPHLHRPPQKAGCFYPRVFLRGVEIHEFWDGILLPGVFMPVTVVIGTGNALRDVFLEIRVLE